MLHISSYLTFLQLNLENKKKMSSARILKPRFNSVNSFPEWPAQCTDVNLRAGLTLLHPVASNIRVLRGAWSGVVAITKPQAFRNFKASDDHTRLTGHQTVI